MNYRIKEQYGFFFIEKEVETTIETTNLLSDILPQFFKPKTTVKKAWFEISSRGYISGIFNPSIKFKTFELAKKYIDNLSPKYHEYDEFCNCNFKNRNLETSTYFVCKDCDKKL